MKTIVSIAVTAGLCLIATVAQAADQVGFRQLTIPVPELGGTIPAFVWYPTAAGGTKTLLGDNAVFYGHEAFRDAPVEAGGHPLIVVSHGSGGNAVGLGWLNASLAAMGYVVVAPNHPGTTSGDSSPKKTVELWNRPINLSATLDAIMADPTFAPSIDPARIGALGFSLGGHDVMALAGAEQRRRQFAEFCFREQSEASGTCKWLARGGVDLTALDPRFEENHRDPRIKAIVAVDPGLTQSFAEETLNSIRVPVQFINLGTQQTTPSIVEAHYLASIVPGARLKRVPDAVHFSFLGRCKPEASKILESIGDDPVCTDAGGRDRAALHQDMISILGVFLSETLPDSK